MHGRENVKTKKDRTLKRISNIRLPGARIVFL